MGLFFHYSVDSNLVYLDHEVICIGIKIGAPVGSHIAGVTVVMRTKNCAGILNQTLKALFSQTFTAFDLLVIDSSSTDSSLEIAQQYRCKTMVIEAADYFPGKVLNQVVERISTEIIVFLNSDAVLLTPTALEYLLESFKDKNVQAAFGRQEARPDAETWVKRELIKSFPNEIKAAAWIPFALPFAAMKKEIWRVHPFYTLAWGSEDTEWGHWAHTAGVKVQYVAKASVMHSHNYTFKQLYGRRFIEGEADAFIFKGSHGFWKMLLQVGKNVLSDSFFCIKAGDIRGLMSAPFIRLVYCWAYYRGFSLGTKRVKFGIQDASIGQSEVLKRYD